MEEKKTEKKEKVGFFRKIGRAVKKALSNEVVQGVLTAGAIGGAAYGGYKYGTRKKEKGE